MGYFTDIAAAFVLLVAGGCARAIAQPVWRRLVHWWHTEGNEPAEFKFMDRLVKWMVADIEARVGKLKQKMYEQHAGTKNAGKVPVYGAEFPIDGNEWYHKELEKARQELSKEEFARLEKQLEDAKEWRRRGEATTQRARLED